jgi:hypothetical protein
MGAAALGRHQFHDKIAAYGVAFGGGHFERAITSRGSKALNNTICACT